MPPWPAAEGSARAIVGEVALWLRKPRQGSALVVSDVARLLVVDEFYFDQFLAHVPDFRPYLNKNHRQASVRRHPIARAPSRAPGRAPGLRHGGG